MDIITSLFPNGIWHYAMGGLLIGAGVSLLYLTTGLQGGAEFFFQFDLVVFLQVAVFSIDQSAVQSRLAVNLCTGYGVGRCFDLANGRVRYSNN